MIQQPLRRGLIGITLELLLPISARIFIELINRTQAVDLGLPTRLLLLLEAPIELVSLLDPPGLLDLVERYALRNVPLVGHHALGANLHDLGVVADRPRLVHGPLELLVQLDAYDFVLMFGLFVLLAAT